MQRLFLVLCLVSSLCLTACGLDPDNDYVRPDPIIHGTVLGAGTGAAISAASGHGVGAGLFIGGLSGSLIGRMMGSPAKLLQEINKGDIQTIVVGDNITLVIPTDIYFERGTAQLVPAARITLNKVTDLLMAYEESPIIIEGHTDDVGSHLRDKRMSKHYAQSLLAYFWTHGVEHQRMEAVGYGYDKPVASNATISGSNANRRVEIHFKTNVL